MLLEITELQYNIVLQISLYCIQNLGQYIVLHKIRCSKKFEKQNYFSRKTKSFSKLGFGKY